MGPNSTKRGRLGQRGDPSGKTAGHVRVEARKERGERQNANLKNPIGRADHTVTKTGVWGGARHGLEWRRGVEHHVLRLNCYESFRKPGIKKTTRVQGVFRYGVDNEEIYRKKKRSKRCGMSKRANSDRKVQQRFYNAEGKRNSTGVGSSEERTKSQGRDGYAGNASCLTTEVTDRPWFKHADYGDERKKKHVTARNELENTRQEGPRLAQGGISD